jgi:hypothetical protein
MGKYHYTVDLLFDWFGISSMTNDIFCFYLQNRLIQTTQTGGQQYSDTSPFSIPWEKEIERRERRKGKEYLVYRIGIRMEFRTKITILSVSLMETKVPGDKLLKQALSILF